MDMWIEIQNASKSLYASDGAGLSVLDAVVSAPQALPGEYRAQKRTKHLTEELAVHCKAKPHFPRKSQNPLPVQCLWHDPVH